MRSLHLLKMAVALPVVGCGLLLDPDLRPRDGGVPDGGGLDSRVGGDSSPCNAELCNRLDDDCDGRVDEVFDFETDPEHCGGCDAPCPTDGTIPTCEAGACVLSCLPDREDCDGDSLNGCEAFLGSAATCGDCGRDCGADLCTGPSGSFVCAEDCPPGNDVCAGGCVDLETSNAHCGACDRACTTPDGIVSCIAGDCQITSCRMGTDDCNGDTADGCETLLGTSGNCGACGDLCDADETCAGGSCVPVDCSDPMAWGFMVMPPVDCVGFCGSATIFCFGTSCTCDVSGVMSSCGRVSTCTEAVTSGCCTSP